MNLAHTTFCAAAWTLGAICTAALPAQQPPTPAPAPPTAAKPLLTPEQVVAANRERIRAEIKKLGDAPGWAGSYYYGDGTGVNVSVDLAPAVGFAFTWAGCLGDYDRNCGSVAEKDGRLALTFTFPNERVGFRGLAPVLIPVAWGERRYLVASDRMEQFANDVNSGSEPRRGVHGLTLLRRGDEAKEVQGLPPLQKEFAGLLLQKPIEGLLIAMRDTQVVKGDVLSTRKTTAVVDRGKEHGVWPGMRLYFCNPEGASASIRVTKVEAQTSMVAIDDTRGDKAVVPVEGWTWSTRASWAK